MRAGDHLGGDHFAEVSDGLLTGFERGFSKSASSDAERWICAFGGAISSPSSNQVRRIVDTTPSSTLPWLGSGGAERAGGAEPPSRDKWLPPKAGLPTAESAGEGSRPD